ncbi:LrgB family protein [Magnetospirillum aberrantis]|uniref:LrgB family protein n=1 Tax=Magnetospirillum aberrantis SpK TaxID=908842 RepID=A0A7C9UTN1_9PROT|nr:LrgB family protein [Magnetospirillum aberrantis]NFV80187.1 LrgB family protein [Magnetospirillum aberrantis SpK]
MKGGDLQAIWVYLSTSPLLGLTATLVAYQAAHWLWRKTHMTPLLNPVLVSIVLIGGFLTFTGIEYRVYFDGAQFVHFLLGPATVALAIPLYRQIRLLLRSALAVVVGLVAGATVAAASAMGLAWALGASHRTVLSLAPKSATSPIAMAVSEGIGGLPSLTAVMAILTGIVGSTIAVWVLDAVRVKNEAARGLAMGTAAHGIGTARAIQLGEITGAFSGLAMGLAALVTTVVVPLLVRAFFG